MSGVRPRQRPSLWEVYQQVRAYLIMEHEPKPGGRVGATMRRCNSCTEPATMFCYIRRAGSDIENSYCYIHAVDAGLVEVPLEELQTAARQAGYSVNAVIFLMEAMLASGQLTNARDICFSIVKAARKQFGALSSEVFRSWQITHKTDIGKIVAALVAAGFVHEFEGVAQEDFDTPLTLLDVLGLP